jgi:hypothetical protein
MKIRHNDIDIPQGNPFANCKLNRQKYAEVLTSILSSYPNGFVLAINSEWGTGKTTFIKMWQQYLRNHEFKTLYFNAWENDFDSDPLIALISELKSLTQKDDDEKFKSLLKKGAILTKKILPSLLKGIAEKYIKPEVIVEAIKNTTEGATEILQEEINEYAKKKKGLVEFKKALEEYVNANNNGKPLIFIVDEIDRCRPDYAVEVLENIKHFFSVPNIVFVISIDKEQLCNAIKGFYGSEKINANEYLKRFIDIEYSIPLPSTKDFCTYLYDYFQFDDFFVSEPRSRFKEIADDSKAFINFSSILFAKSNLTLRDQERVLGHARISLSLFKYNSYVYPTLFVLLIYVRFVDINFYKKIRERVFSPSDLIKELEERLSKEFSDNEKNFFAFTEALLLFLYYNYYREIYVDAKLTDVDEKTQKKIVLVESKFYRENPDWFVQRLERFETTNFYTLKIDYLLNIIDLTANLNT